ncbi:hypothetical protein [Pseudoroseicyclus sp. CXY001]|uniref:hypothetical protein n=1 Tax=Pseudoroseicyclus sp. CXY001 TaxID=3242492 RepID=UPI0035715988
MTDHTSQSGPHSEALDELRQTGASLKDEAVARAGEVRDRVSGEAKARAEGAKDHVADEVSSVGKALRSASGELRGGSPQEQIFSQMADGLADLADSVRGKSVGDIARDVGDFGRRNPVAFLGGAALLGFAGARLAKASAEARDSGPSSVGPAVAPYDRSDATATRSTPEAPDDTSMHPQVGEGV